MKRLDDTKPSIADGMTKGGIIAEIRLLKSAINELIDELEAVQKVVFVLCERKKK
jgi:hypothetical protein